ncbi:hypothetical protein BH23ACT5_BH23ACT5_02920 [soil metagenome]
MSGLTDDTWSREPVGFRRGELKGSDGIAVIAVTLIGGPALIVGAAMVEDHGLDLLQVLLVAPLAALIGGVLIGSSAQMAAKTGANSVWLLRPAFGRWGGWVVALVRLAMVGLWAVVGLMLVGEWGAQAAQSFGVALPRPVVIGLVAAAGLAMALAGVVRTTMHVIKRPLFWSSVALMALLAWRMTDSVAFAPAGVDGQFWGALQYATELAVVFVPFVQTVARRLANEEEAFTSFGVGYTVPATAMLLVGAVFVGAAGTFPFDLTAIDIGLAGPLFAIAWVVVAEIDQGFSAFVATGSETVGVIPSVSVIFLGVAGAVGVVVAAVFLADYPIVWASLAAALAFPAAVIAVADFMGVRSLDYPESDIYGIDAGPRFNVAGVVCWLLAVVVGQLLDPSIDEWVSDVSRQTDVDLPWRLLAAVAGALIYLITARQRNRRAVRPHELRGV